MSSRLLTRCLASVLAASLALPAPLAAQSQRNQASTVVEPPPPDPVRARRAAESARRAEQAGDWASAFDHFSDAVSLWPAEREYWVGREAARFRLIQQRMDLAERAATAGRMAEARTEMLAALALDPEYTVARERLQQFSSSGSPRAIVLPPEDPAPVALRPDPGVRTIIHRGNVTGAFEDLAQQFGLTVSFDPDLQPKQLRFRVEDAGFYTAVEALCRQTNTFWRTLGERSFLVAANTPAKRREYAPQVVRTVLLSGAVSPEEMTETLRIVREIAGISRTQLDTRSRTITLRDTPEAVAVALDLIQEIESARGEMMLEITLLEFDRARARRLGITPPDRARLLTINPNLIRDVQQSPQELLQILTELFGTSPTGGPVVPPLIAFGGGKTILLATLPGAAAAFERSLRTLHSARRMLLRTSDGEQASFFVGTRFPVNLFTFAGNLAVPTQVPSTGQEAFRREDSAAGNGPNGLAALDLNADAMNDLAVTNELDNTVTILLGNGNGRFGAPTPFPTASSPRGVVIANFDAGTVNDLAVVNGGSDSVSIFLGNGVGSGDGTFQPRADFPAGIAPSALTAASLNNTDTFLDLAVVNEGSNTVSVFLGVGDGTLQTRMDFPTGLMPSAVIARDFDGDNVQDLAVTNAGDGTFSILLGNGNGTFDPRMDFSTGLMPRGIASGAFNDDSFLDLAVANEGSNTVSVFFGNSNGIFGGRTDFNVGNAPRAVLSAQLTADGFADIVTANSGSGSITVLVGAGAGLFPLRTDFPTGAFPTAVLAADFTADGRFDVATANRDSDNVTVTVNSTVFVVPPGGAIVPQTPFPGFSYEDIGLKVRATPRMHAGKEVTLQLQFEIRSLGSENLNGIPIISNRTVEQTVRLRENETSILAGILQTEQERTRRGWPGFSSVPGTDHLTGRQDREQRETELVIAITPRRIRLPERADRSRYYGRENTAIGATAGPP